MHVMNITDVGHLTDDGDHGEDKMEKGSKREWLTARDIARKYENNFKQYLQELHIQFDAHPRATDYIKEQIDIVKELEEKWYTYTIPWDGIYMDTSKISDYGKLLWKNFKEHLAWLQSWIRVEDEWKKNLTDFALWKFSPAWEQRQMEWIFDWPRWGVLLDETNRIDLSNEENATRGFPGWHIECSAMSRALLWDHFDIHTWGVEHIPIHHSDEIAQSECSFCHWEKWVNYRLHGQFLNINGAKVSKSAWDDLSIPWIVAKWYSPLDIRYFFFTGQYRNFLDFTREALEAAKVTRHNLIKKIYNYIWDRIVHFYDVQKEDISDILYAQLTSNLLDDLDTPAFLASIQKAVWNINDEVLKVILYIDAMVLKVWLYEGVVALVEKPAVVVPDDIRQIAEARRFAKQKKHFVLADELRNELLWKWWVVEDTKDAYVINPL
jgi:cysteinyl-tRNA synthetase